MSVTLLVSGIALSPNHDESDAFHEAICRLRKNRLLQGAYKGNELYIARRSVDARRKNQIRLVYTVAVGGLYLSEKQKKSLPSNITIKAEEAPLLQKGHAPLPHPPVVVGSGPAGLFSALMLAEEGYHPILLERGGDVGERIQAVSSFYKTKQLNTETNIQFGAGGAGTFSDGKLVTRVNDSYQDYVLKKFVEFGAPREILWQAKPHIGTDYLRIIVSNMLEKIKSLGGEVRFHAKLEDITVRDGRLSSIRVSGTDMPCEVLLLAIGHSARDTYRMLLSKPLSIEAKPFSVGMRIEHLQADIDSAMYGDFAGHKRLGHAEYALSSHTDTRGVYTFCMCPGGEVMAAASEQEALVVNGMSNHLRDGKNANAAVAVSVFPDDYGNTPQSAIDYQRKIERLAFASGGGDYAVPLCTVGDLLADSYHTEPSRIVPTYMGGKHFKVASPSTFLPPEIVSSLRDGIRAFGQKLQGYDVCDAVLSGAETRTSAPVRILRGSNREALGCQGLYPCGEGAGYAGGITSAALDGLRTAIALMAVYAPPF